MSESIKEPAFDVVNNVVVVGGRENNVPQEPATDAEEHGYGTSISLILEFPKLQLGGDDNDASGESKISHCEQAIVHSEYSVTIKTEHDEEHDDCL